MDSSSPRSPLDGDDDYKEFDDGYDENLMGDEEDKKKLAQMTEKEREQELFNRSERREMLKIRFEIGRKLKNKRELEKKQSKQVRANKRLRASEVYSSDDSSEDSDEYTPDTDKSSAPNEIQTTSKSSKINTRASALLISSSSGSSASSASSSAGSSSESEQEHDDLDHDEDSRTMQNDFQMTLNDLRSIQLKRDRIEQWLYSRFFDDTAKDLFVKISVGNHSQTLQHMYKVAQITKIIEGASVYKLNPNTHSTKKYCIVNIGGNNRTYKMSYISNRTFDEDDFLKWRDQINADGQGMPTRELFLRKKRELNEAINHIYTDEDIAYEVNERNKYKDAPNNFALRKTELMGEKADAEASNDFEKARLIQMQIDELEERAKQLEKSRSSSTFSAISFVNERNRIKNIEESERVLKESKSVKTEDPFTRRKCTPQIVHNRNINGDSNSKTDDKIGYGSNGKSADPSKSVDVADGAGGGGNSKVDDLFSAHSSIDLDIDI